MAQDFFDHYWDTVRWKEVAREARPVSSPAREAGWDERAASAYSGETMTLGAMLLFLVKFVVALMLMAMCAVGTFVTVRFFFGGLWGFGGAVLVFLVAWLVCARWCRE
ncbi:MAG: hypothetical protein V4787_05985 [Pseudomonadota bacterium]